jgi:hypothetical protein
VSSHEAPSSFGRTRVAQAGLMPAGDRVTDSPQVFRQCQLHGVDISRGTSSQIEARLCCVTDLGSGSSLSHELVRLTLHDRLDSRTPMKQGSRMKDLFPLTAVLLLAFNVSLLAQPSSNTNLAESLSNQAPIVSFSPDGSRLVTKSPGGEVRIWDAKTGKPVPASPPHWGTWQLMSFKYGDDTKWTDRPQAQRKIKLITETQFAWVEYEVASGKVLSMAGGPYTLSGGAYTETIAYGGEGMTDYVGKPQPFTIRVEGDKLHQSGQLSDGIKIEEVWQRVK